MEVQHCHSFEQEQETGLLHDQGSTAQPEQTSEMCSTFREELPFAGVTQVTYRV